MSAEGESFAASVNGQLENILDGKLWRGIDDSGEEIVADADEMQSRFGLNFEDEYEPVSMWDFIADCYDKHFVVEGDCTTYRSIMLMLAGGGPTAWLNTENGMIEFSWGGESENFPVCWGACDEIDECGREMWENR